MSGFAALGLAPRLGLALGVIAILWLITWWAIA
jgi:hypothetical protein